MTGARWRCEHIGRELTSRVFIAWATARGVMKLRFGCCCLVTRNDHNPNHIARTLVGMPHNHYPEWANYIKDNV